MIFRALIIILLSTHWAIADGFSLKESRQCYLDTWREAPLHVVRETFVSRPASHFGDLAPCSSNAFDPDESILIYLEVRGYEFRDVPGGVAFGITIDFELRAENSRVLIRQQGLHNAQVRSASEVLELFANIRVGIGGIQGPLVAVLIVGDRETDETVEVSMYFDIET